MRITLQSSENIQNVMRRCGYFFIKEENGELAFMRPLSSSGSGYPRFHIYVDEAEQTLVFNLHLDQKKASYAGQTAHSGEYDNSLVEQEAVRLKSLLQ